MKNILDWYTFLCESEKKSFIENEPKVTTSTSTSTTTLDPNIEYSNDQEGNQVEFNKKKRLEITYHKDKKDEKGKRLIIKKGHYDTQNKKDGVWKELDLKKNIEITKNYYQDKLHGLVLKKYGEATKDYSPILIEEIWTYGRLVGTTIESKNGDVEKRTYVNGDIESYSSIKKNADGDMIWEKKYTKTKPSGLWRWWIDGEFYSMNYTNGQPDGWGKNINGEIIAGTEPKK
jgi:hypothetical protein